MGGYRPVRRALGIALALASVGPSCTQPTQSVVFVKVTSPNQVDGGNGGSGVRQLQVTFINGPAQTTRDYPPTPSDVDLWFPTSLSATFPTSHAGLLTVQVVALSAAAAQVAVGASYGTIVVGGELDLVVPLSTCTSSACNPPDGGLLEAGLVDAWVPPVDARIDAPLPRPDAGVDRALSFCQSHPDGTQCAPALDSCHSPSYCMSGVCAAPGTLPDGTTCGSGNACNNAPTCQSGKCTANPKPNGTSCPAAQCQTASCQSGVCVGANLPDGRYCGGDGVSGPSNTLYDCSGGSVRYQATCPLGCHYSPLGSPDYCTPNCGVMASGCGYWCGDATGVNGDANELYQCCSGTLSGYPAFCVNGCMIAPPGSPDYCK